MRNLFIFTLLICFSHNLTGQININFKVNNFSVNPIDSFTVWSQIDYGKTSKLYKFEGNSSSILLPPSKYTSFIIDFYRKGKKYHYLELISFTTEKEINDTIINIPAYKLDAGDTYFWDVRYYFSDELCNGHYTDYYKNGQQRLKGKFKNGLPVGKLYYYNKKGSLIKTEKYNRKGKLKKTIKNE